MKIKIFILALISLFLISCENTPENPFSPEVPKKPALVHLWMPSITFSPRYWDWPKEPPWPTEAEFIVTGRVYNEGELPAKNVKLIAKIYDSEWNKLWNGEYLITTQLDSNVSLGFEAHWSELAISIFCELDETGRPLNESNWDYNYTLGRGIEIAWE